MKRSIVSLFQILAAVLIAAALASAQLVHSFNSAAAHSVVIHQAEHSAVMNSARPHFNSSALDSVGSHSTAHVNTVHPSTFSHPSNAFSAHFSASPAASTIHVQPVHIGAAPALQSSHLLTQTKTAAIRDVGLANRGYQPKPGTRVRPEGIPNNWRIRNTDSLGGTSYFKSKNLKDEVRVMQGNSRSPYPNSQKPYVRWDKDAGPLRKKPYPLDIHGNKLLTAKTEASHIPLADFKFRKDLFK